MARLELQVTTPGAQEAISALGALSEAERKVVLEAARHGAAAGTVAAALRGLSPAAVAAAQAIGALTEAERKGATEAGKLQGKLDDAAKKAAELGKKSKDVGELGDAMEGVVSKLGAIAGPAALFGTFIAKAREDFEKMVEKAEQAKGANKSFDAGMGEILQNDPSLAKDPEKFKKIQDYVISRGGEMEGLLTELPSAVAGARSKAGAYGMSDEQTFGIMDVAIKQKKVDPKTNLENMTTNLAGLISADKRNISFAEKLNAATHMLGETKSQFSGTAVDVDKVMKSLIPVMGRQGVSPAEALGLLTTASKSSDPQAAVSAVMNSFKAFDDRSKKIGIGAEEIASLESKKESSDDKIKRDRKRREEMDYDVSQLDVDARNNDVDIRNNGVDIASAEKHARMRPNAETKEAVIRAKQRRDELEQRRDELKHDREKKIADAGDLDTEIKAESTKNAGYSTELEKLKKGGGKETAIGDLGGKKGFAGLQELIRKIQAGDYGEDKDAVLSKAFGDLETGKLIMGVMADPATLAKNVGNMTDASKNTKTNAADAQLDFKRKNSATFSHEEAVSKAKAAAEQAALLDKMGAKKAYSKEEMQAKEDSIETHFTDGIGNAADAFDDGYNALFHGKNYEAERLKSRRRNYWAKLANDGTVHPEDKTDEEMQGIIRDKTLKGKNLDATDGIDRDELARLKTSGVPVEALTALQNAGQGSGKQQHLLADILKALKDQKPPQPAITVKKVSF